MTWASKPERETIMGSAEALRVMRRILLTERPEPETKAHATVSPTTRQVWGLEGFLVAP